MAMAMKKPKRAKAPRQPEPVRVAAFPIVGVGASAGGLEAATQLLRHLPGDARMALVLVQHLDPGQPSALTSLLSRVTKLAVVEAENGTRVQCGHVYVIPPNKTLGISKGILKLSPRAKVAEPHSPVNYFLKALAEDQGHRAVGVILSGTGHDGADGLEAIKAANGITFAQTEKTAKHPGMPASASGAADFILSPEEIAAELVRISQHPAALLRPAEESVAGFAALFELVDAKQRIYAKRAVAEPLAARLPPFVAGLASRDAPAAATVRRGSENVLGEIRKQADALVLSEFAPDGVVVNSRMDILQFRGRTESYLSHGPGTANLNLLQMARQGLAVELRPLVARAAKQNRAVTREGVQIRTDGHVISADVRVIPFKVPPSEERFFLVLFEQKAAKAAQVLPRGNAGRRTAAQREIVQLRDELALTKLSLHGLMEEHEATDEELRAANEEALSSNEELQSTNEELETAKEELQSTNEELTTLNEELQNRNLELQEVSDDLLNVFNSVDFAVVILDKELRVRRFTPVAQKILGLIPGDVGRTVADLKLSLGLPELYAAIICVVDSLAPEEREIQDREGRWYKIRVRPYRTADSRINGVVFSMQDIDQLKRSLAESERTRCLAQGIVATVREPLLVLDAKLRVKTANRSFYELFQMKPAETEGRFIYDLGGGQWNLPELRELLEKILPSRTTLENFPLDAAFPVVGRKHLLLTARKLATQRDGDDWMLLAVQDMTERK